MKPTLSGVFVAVVICSALGFWGYHEMHSRIEHKTWEAKRAKKDNDNDAKIRALAARYDAVIEWNDKTSTQFYGPYSLEIEDMIVNTGGKPIIVDDYLDDVARHGDKYYLYFDSTRQGSFTIRFELECSLEVARRVVTKGENIYNYAAVRSTPCCNAPASRHASSWS